MTTNSLSQSNHGVLWMSAVASGVLTMFVSVFMQREGVVAIQVIAYGIWFFFSKYVNHYPPGKLLLFNTLRFFSF
ncbi:MAG: hypothetical protein ACRD8Z_03670 [Nitrososphaeraceae archaeon]